MLRMNDRASIRNSRTSPTRSQLALKTVRSKRWWAVSVGVNAVKSCVPTSAAAQACSASKSIGYGHHSARPRSNGSGAERVCTR